MAGKYSGKYWDEFKVGDKFTTGARTVTEADRTNFCGLAGIYNPLFMDQDFAEKSLFKERAVPGPLIFLIATGCWMRMGLLDGTVMAFLGLDKMRALLPVRIGDTLYSEVEFIQMRETRDVKRGIITALHKVLNQNDEVVLRYEMTYMLARKPGE